MRIGEKELVITPAPLADAMALQKAIGRALKGARLDLPGSVKEELKPESLSSIIDAVLGVAVDDEVEACLWRCAERAVLGNEKVTRDFFEKVDNRAHYYPIMYEVIIVNCGPFFRGIVSKFGDITGKIGISPTSK